MERGESILDAIFDEDNLEDVQDVEMMDIEEGELVGQDSQTELGQNIGGDVHAVNQESSSKNRRRRNNKKKNRRKKGSSGPNVTDINRLMSNGLASLLQFRNLVDAIQACGGQKTADGRRFRNGGGILWSVLKTRDPNAFKEIMKKGKEFEKQFRQGPVQNKEASPERTDTSPERTDHASMDQTTASASDGSQLVPHVQNQLKQSSVDGKRVSVHDRMRVPVTYDDLLEEEDLKNKST